MIRVATADDAEQIASIERACFGDQAWSLNLVREEIASPRHIVLLDDAAYIAVSVAGEDSDLDRIACLPSAQGQGKARALLEAGVDRARDLGAGRMLLEVAADNVAAIGLYESCGFDQIATRRGYYAGGVDALVMELAISEWR
jgi:ribosomal-protein-alanine N-acetyltransferase